jgi:CBS domain-containing protein
MTVADLMREDVVTTPPDVPINEVATTMRDEVVGSVVVVEDSTPVGLVTDRDLAVRIVADRLDAGRMIAGDVMTGEPVTIGADAGVMELSETMCRESVRRMPVVDDGTLVGIVTLDDLGVLLTAELGNLAGVVEAESPPY